MSFFDKLEARVEATNSLLCVGLDPHEKDLLLLDDNNESSLKDPQKRGQAVLRFCRNIIKATLSLAACYKPNAAFFENFEGGIEILKQIISEVKQEGNDVPVLLDVKRGDIGSTALAYAQACYDYVGADAVTLSPLMGWDSVSPFVTGTYKDKGAFLLCKTSNPGSNELLTLPLSASGEQQQQEFLYERIAHLVGSDWNAKALEEEEKCTTNTTSTRMGLVVGATDSEALRNVRRVAGDNVWILAPGVGAQGGNLKEALEAGFNTHGSGLLIPVSRGISRAEDPKQAAMDLQKDINTVREQYRQQQESKTEEAESSLVLLPHQQDFIEFSLSQGVLKFGSFVLKSGRTSPYFFNAGLFASGQALYKLGRAYASTIMHSKDLVTEKTPNFDILFGPAYKGISLGAVVSSILFQEYGVDVGFAYNRKEAKDHGEGGMLVGSTMDETTRVLIIDDVITAGTAIRESYHMLHTVRKVPIVGVVIALDRAEKKSLESPVSAVQAVEQDLKVPVVSIVNLPQLQLFLKSSSYSTTDNTNEEILRSVSEYRAEYGV